MQSELVKKTSETAQTIFSTFFSKFLIPTLVLGSIVAIYLSWKCCYHSKDKITIQKDSYIVNKGIDAKEAFITKSVPVFNARDKGNNLKLVPLDIAVMVHLELAFRHAPNAKQGRKECEEGIERGDAISLAGYTKVISEHKKLRNVSHLKKDECSNYSTFNSINDLVDLYNREMKLFIKLCFKCFGTSNGEHVFIVLKRGNEALFPYDFQSYILGKCGSRQVEHDDLHFGIDAKISDSSNEDILDQRVNDVFQTVIEQIKVLSEQHHVEAEKQLESIEFNFKHPNW